MLVRFLRISHTLAQLYIHSLVQSSTDPFSNKFSEAMFLRTTFAFPYHTCSVCVGGTVCPGAVAPATALARCSCPSPAVPCSAYRNTYQWTGCWQALCSR